MAAGAGEAEDVRYRAKPMNCPFHILIYGSRQRSYRDLPIRLAEVANVYRNELSGTLHGLLRVRGLSMDDAHIFCREDQIEEEIFQMLDLTDFVLHQVFGLEYRLDLATRPDKKIGGDAQWDVAETALAAALKKRGLTYGIDAHGGAFYGPKIDVKIRDAIGREWQGTTLPPHHQAPQRVPPEYVGSPNRPPRPGVVHRAVYRNHRAVVGGLVRNFRGAF